MVSVQRVITPPKLALAPNPYDMVALTINGKPMTGRPYEWDGVVADHTTLRTDMGKPVTPIKVATLCPDCGAGLFLDLTFNRTYTCGYCQKAPEPPVDPFINPFQLGAMDTVDLDLIELLDEQPQTTVADRLSKPSELD